MGISRISLTRPFIRSIIVAVSATIIIYYIRRSIHTSLGYDSIPNKLQQNVCQVDNLCKIVVDNILKIDQNRNVACG